MNGTLESSLNQPGHEATLTPTATTTTEKPQPDPEAIAKYEADYPNVVKDPVLAMLIATATKYSEENIRDHIERSLSFAKRGKVEDATLMMQTATNYAIDAQETAKFVTKLYNEAKLLLDGKIPAPTE